MSHSLKTLAVSLLLMGALAPAARAEQPTTAPWHDLFDGKSLDGWEVKQGTAHWDVRDGMIVGTTAARSPNSFLCTKKEYGNFVLEIDFKVDEGLNSGVQVRSESTRDYKDGRVHGYQVEIDPAQKSRYQGDPSNLRADGTPVPAGAEPRRWTGGIYDEGRRGWLSNLTGNEPARRAFKPGEWNHFRIEAAGDSIKVWLNGVPAGAVTDSMTRNGFIGLQVHATESPTPMHVWFRNIRIQDRGPNAAKPGKD